MLRGLSQARGEGGYPDGVEEADIDGAAKPRSDGGGRTSDEVKIGTVYGEV